MIKVERSQALGILCHLLPMMVMVELLSNPIKSTQLQIELVIIVDIVIKATYNLEEARPLALSHMNISFLYSS